MARRRSSARGGLGCLLLIVLIVGGALWLSVFRNWTGPGPARQPTTVVVPQGATLAAAARELERVGAVRSTTGFLRFARYFGSDAPIRTGEYEVTPHMSAKDIFALLQSGRTVQRMITIPEGMPSIEVFERLARERLLKGKLPIPPEGSVLPGTYSFQRGEPRKAVLKRMQDAMTQTLNRLWMTRKADTVANSKAEALTLASSSRKRPPCPRSGRWWPASIPTGCAPTCGSRPIRRSSIR